MNVWERPTQRINWAVVTDVCVFRKSSQLSDVLYGGCGFGSYPEGTSCIFKNCLHIIKVMQVLILLKSLKASRYYNFVVVLQLCTSLQQTSHHKNISKLCFNREVFDDQNMVLLASFFLSLWFIHWLVSPPGRARRIISRACWQISCLCC